MARKKEIGDEIVYKAIGFMIALPIIGIGLIIYGIILRYCLFN